MNEKSQICTLKVKKKKTGTLSVHFYEANNHPLHIIGRWQYLQTHVYSFDKVAPSTLVIHMGQSSVKGTRGYCRDRG